MKHLTNFPICGRDIAIDMSCYLRPCVLNDCDSVSQYLCIITTPYWEFVIFIVCCHFISLYYLPREGPLLLLQAVQKVLPRLFLSFCKDNYFFWESILFLLFFLFFRSHVCRIRCYVCRIRFHDSVVIFLFRMFAASFFQIPPRSGHPCYWLYNSRY